MHVLQYKKLAAIFDGFCYRFNRVSAFDNTLVNISRSIMNHQFVFINQLSTEQLGLAFNDLFEDKKVL